MQACTALFVAPFPARRTRHARRAGAVFNSPLQSMLRRRPCLATDFQGRFPRRPAMCRCRGRPLERLAPAPPSRSALRAAGAAHTARQAFPTSAAAAAGLWWRQRRRVCRGYPAHFHRTTCRWSRSLPGRWRLLEEFPQWRRRRHRLQAARWGRYCFPHPHWFRRVRARGVSRRHGMTPPTRAAPARSRHSLHIQ